MPTKYPGYNNNNADSRDYPGYEDYSPEGRAQIRAFNRAGGPMYLNRRDGGKREYDAARQYADDTRQRAQEKSEPSRGISDARKRKMVADALRK